jgi:large subunit ribosomal protein L29
MNTEKIRELSDEELKNQERDIAEQMFRLRFQLATGQTEGLNKLRSLKKDVARIKTIRRQRELSGAKAFFSDASPGRTSREASNYGESRDTAGCYGDS